MIQIIFMGELYRRLLRGEPPCGVLPLRPKKALSHRRPKPVPRRRMKRNIDVYVSLRFLEKLRKLLFRGGALAHMDLSQPFSIHISRTTINVDVNGMRLMVAKVYEIRISDNGRTRPVSFKLMHIDMTQCEADLSGFGAEEPNPDA